MQQENLDINAYKKKLHALIAEKSFITNQDEQIEVKDNPEAWIFDFRKILMHGETADRLAEIFYDQWKKDYPIQLGTLEIAGVPLVTTFMNKFYSKGNTDVNAFFIRKSRKKKGLLRMIEGEVLTGTDILLVDDIMNSGNSFWRQIEVLEELGHRVTAVWSILQFRDDTYYQRFHNRGIAVHSLFTLNDFTSTLGNQVQNLVSPPPKKPPQLPFTPLWRFQSEYPSLFWVLPKSQPVIDNENIYFGADNQTFWALNQSDGAVNWKFHTANRSKRKAIFSNPVLHNDMVIFGAYDGNVYALDSKTGARKWVNYDADWVGSSPTVAAELGLVFIGLEFGLFRKRGGMAALDLKTGVTVWSDQHPAYTHATPVYISTKKQVAIGSNDGKMRLYNAVTGDLVWSFTTFGGSEYETSSDKGFSEGDIKEAAVYDDKRDWILFGSMDGFLYILERSTGHLVHHQKCQFAVWGTPLLYKNCIYFSSLDKQLRCLALDTLTLVFSRNIDNTRIFASPAIINDRLYIGTNAGRLHELDPKTGEELGYFQALERITNTPLYNSTTETFFLPTFANEIIALKRTGRVSGNDG